MNTSENNQNSEIPAEVLDEIRSNARRRAQDAKHDFVQQGVWLVCRSCEYTHAVPVEVGKMFAGMKDGKPVFVDMFEARK